MEVKNPQHELKLEFDNIQNHPNTCTGCTIGLFEKNNYFVWKISLVGAKDSLYSGGLFFLKIVFPDDYPNNSPRINFLTPIYHLNVCPIKDRNQIETLGYISENVINFKPPIRAKEVITKLFAIFYENNKDTIYLPERVYEFSNNKALFELKAKYFTKKYTNIKNLNDIFKYSNKDWDFSYNKYIVKIKNTFDNILKKKKISTMSYNINSDETINIKVNMNGVEEKSIQCKKKDSTKEVINKFLEENKIENKNVLFIFGLKELNFEVSIGENGLRDNYFITMIYDYNLII